MRRTLHLVALVLAVTLMAAACGDDDNEGDGGGAAPAEDGGAGDSEGDAADGSSLTFDEDVEVAEGTTLPLSDCPSGWDPYGGITDTEIRLGISLAESGPFASFAPIDDGMQAYFDHINETDPIEGKNVVVISRDDAYDPARTVTNVEEILETEDVFAFDALVGTPQNFAVRDMLNDECVPQILNGSGHPAWGDPENYPWTTGGLLSYNTESQLWCNYIVDEIGEGATVAGLFVDNDFGNAYQSVLEGCADDGQIDLVESVRLDPASPDLTDEVTTIAASDADVAALGISGTFCSQAMSAIDASAWQPTVLLSNTCQSIATYFTPVDPAGDGVITVAYTKEVGDPRFADDEAVQLARQVLEAADLDPDRGAAITGTLFAMGVEPILREASAMEGGLNRVNLMRASWNADFDHPLQLEGMHQRTDGTNDAYMVEAGQFAQYTFDEATSTGHYEYLGDLISVEGETGVFEGE